MADADEVLLPGAEGPLAITCFATYPIMLNRMPMRAMAHFATIMLLYYNDSI